jgi:uncharacterized RDD family membrane protein YckC
VAADPGADARSARRRGDTREGDAMEPTPSEMPSGSPEATPPPQAPTPPPQAPAPPPQAPAPAPQMPPQPAWMASMTSTAPVAGPAGFFYADIPNRSIAYIIDAIILFVGFLVVAAVLGGIGLHTVTVDFTSTSLVSYNPIAGLIYGVVNLAISVAYFVYTWTAMRGTVGMKALGMQIGNAQDGATITMDQALRRALVLFGVGAIAQALGSWPSLGILFSLAAFAWFVYLLYTTAVSPTKQGFHDKFANNMVVKAARSVA